MLSLDAGEHRLLRSGNLRTIPVLGLGEDRQQDDPPAWSAPVGDADRLSRKIEPKLTKPAVQLLGVRLGEQDTPLGQQVDVERCVTEVGAIETFKPVPDLRLKFDRTPRHTSDAIASIRGTGHPYAVELHDCHITAIREAPPRRAGTIGRVQRDPSIANTPVNKSLDEGLLNRGEMEQGPPVGRPCSIS